MFYKFFEIFHKSLMSIFLLNVSSEPKFWRRHCSTKRERNSCMKFCLMFPLNQNSGSASAQPPPPILGSRKPHGRDVKGFKGPSTSTAKKTKLTPLQFAVFTPTCIIFNFSQNILKVYQYVEQKSVINLTKFSNFKQNFFDLFLFFQFSY